MGLVERKAIGLESLELATELLQRARRADSRAGIWEAADVQWWWRKPRRSDAVTQHFLVDALGPVAAVVITDWDDWWACDVLTVPGRSPRPALMPLVLEAIDRLRISSAEMLIRDDDDELRRLAAQAGFVPRGRQSYGTSMSAADRPPVHPLPDGFVLTDRSDATSDHPMTARNGAAVEARLRQCSLYDPRLDLSVATDDGTVVGYGLFWADPTTGVGLIEPIRVEAGYERRGVATSIVTAGIARLASRGSRRIKVGFGTDAARALYLGLGFRLEWSATPFRRVVAPFA